MSVRLRALFGLAVLACAASAAAPVAEASFPGTNGVIAFTREGSRGAGTIWAVHPGSGRMRQLTRVSARCRKARTWRDYEPSFSASGRVLIYVHEDECDRRTVAGIYLMRTNGTGRRLIRATGRIGYEGENPESLALSPSETHAAYSDVDGEFQVFRVPRPDQRAVADDECSYGWAEGGRCAYLRTDRFDSPSQPAWASTGQLALTLSHDDIASSGHIGIVDWANVSGDRAVLQRVVTLSMVDARPDWSPNAHRIAFERSFKRVFERGITRQALEANVFVELVHSDGPQRPRRLTDTDNAFFPVWSPNGRRIAYVRSHNYDEQRNSVGSLWTMRASDGEGQRRIARRIVADQISWQPRPRR